MLHRQLSQWRGMCKWWTGYIGDVCNTVTVTGDLTYGTGYWVPDIEHINANFPAWMEARLINRCLIKLKKQNVNYALALAEASKSIGLIGNAFQRLWRAYGSAKRFRWARAARELGVPKPSFKSGSKDVSGRWLELQYGWLPLLNDVYGAYEDARDSTAFDPVVSVKYSTRQTLDSETSVNFTGAKGVCKQRGFHAGTCRLDYTLDCRATRLAAKVGLTNPAQVAWELVPFSFVLDWALPVGEWLESWDADFGLTFKGGSVSKFTKVDRKYSLSSPSGPVISVSAVASSKLERLDRTAFQETPFAPPAFKSPVSVGHALNSLALLRARFR
jgi:hypothetical protein